MNDASPNSKILPALEQIRVVDLSRSASGAACAEILAWFGADVAKIEAPMSRNAGHSATSDTAACEFLLLNANKRSVICDLGTQRGKDDLRKLILNADILIHDWGVGAIEQSGLDYHSISQLNPELIYAQIQGFPSDSSRAHYLSSDAIAQAVGGAIAATGFEGTPPVKPGPSAGDIGTALHGAMGILAALYQRQSTGRGQRIDISQQGAVINLNRTGYVDQLTQRKPLERMGNAARNATAPSNLYPCKPGGPNDYVFIHINKAAHKHWQALLKVMGREDLLDDPKYSTPEARNKNRDAINDLVGGWCSERTKIDAMDLIQRAGATAGAVLDAHDLSTDPYLRDRGVFVTVKDTVHGDMTMPAWPVRLSASHVPMLSAPSLGAHTEQVLSEWATRDSKPRTTTAQISERHSPALSGVKVLDLTQFEAGPSCTEALAWLGADVVKIEEPERGERGRYGNTDKRGVDGYYFILLNANKRSLTCDIKSEGGREILKQLIKQADVMVENMAPGVIERLGFGYDEVHQLNPRIVFAQIKGFALEGPTAKYLCFDVISQAVGGAMSITGVPGQPPLRSGTHFGDTGAGLHCVTGILAALCQRQRTGQGQRVQIAMQESVINFSRKAFADYLAMGKLPERHGNSNIYVCKGGGPNDYCVIEADDLDDRQWQRLLQAIGHQDLSADMRFANQHARRENCAEVEALLSSWCRTVTKIQAMDVMQGVGVRAGAVLDTQELGENADLRRAGLFATIEHPVRGPITIPAWPVQMSESRVEVRSAPLLGKHTEEVLSEWLGLSKDHIEAFNHHKSAAT